MHLPLPGQIPPTFFSLLTLGSSAWKSPGSISALTQGGRSGHLFMLSCSVVLWKGRDTVNCWCIWGAPAVAGPGGSCHSPRPACTSQGQAAQAPRYAMRARFQVSHVSPQGSWSQAVTLPPDSSHSGSHKDVSSDWHSAHTWWQMQFLGPRLQRSLAFYLSASRSVKVS